MKHVLSHVEVVLKCNMWYYSVHYSHRNSRFTARVHILDSTKAETKIIFVFVSVIFLLWIRNGLNPETRLYVKSMFSLTRTLSLLVRQADKLTHSLTNMTVTARTVHKYQVQILVPGSLCCVKSDPTFKNTRDVANPFRLIAFTRRAVGWAPVEALA